MILSLFLTTDDSRTEHGWQRAPLEALKNVPGLHPKVGATDGDGDVGSDVGSNVVGSGVGGNVGCPEVGSDVGA